MASKTSSKPSAAKRKSKPPAAKQDGVVQDGARLIDARTFAVRAQDIEAPISRMPTHDEIAFRAFELYQLRAHSEGGALNDWLAAERELRAS